MLFFFLFCFGVFLLYWTSEDGRWLFRLLMWSWEFVLCFTHTDSYARFHVFRHVADSEKIVSPAKSDAFDEWCKAASPLDCARAPLYPCSEGAALKQPPSSSHNHPQQAPALFRSFVNHVWCACVFLFVFFFLAVQKQDNAPHVNNGWNLSSGLGGEVF